MILRRLAESIRSQDWFVVVIEILIVVVGIFLGLQVDDWNQQRKDQSDEQVFLQRLHADLLLAEDLSARVRDRRLDRVQVMVQANDVLTGRAERDSLSGEECTAIGSSSFYNINVLTPPSIEELIGTGRLHIVRDADLRGAVIDLRQTADALRFLIALQTSQGSFAYLPTGFPDLIYAEASLDAENDNEVRAKYFCDLEGMRADRLFLNQWSANLDGYDAYVRDGLKPWLEAQDQVHALVDGTLGIKHD